MDEKTRKDTLTFGMQMLDEDHEYIRLGEQRYVHCVVAAKTQEEVTEYIEALARWHSKREGTSLDEAREIERKTLADRAMRIGLLAGGNAKEQTERIFTITNFCLPKPYQKNVIDAIIKEQLASKDWKNALSDVTKGIRKAASIRK